MSAGTAASPSSTVLGSPSAPRGRDPEARIHQLFDNPPAGPLSAAELTFYFADPISRSALVNAIQFKYLTEAVQPWFAPAP
jgi:hypothetical protein